MKENFNRPAFLKPEAKLEAAYTDPKNDEEHFHHGGFVVMADLKNIPKGTSEKIPSGYVLKQYYLDEYSPDWNELFEADEEINTNTSKKGWEQHIIIKAFEDAFEQFGRRPTVVEILSRISDNVKSGNMGKNADELVARTMAINEELIAQILKKYSLETKAKKLKQRYERIRNIFSAELPNIIVPTQFIIGAEKNQQHPDRDGTKRLYELQPKINALELERYENLIGGLFEGNNIFGNPHEPIPEYCINIIKNWAKQIKKAFPKQWQQIKEELKKFIELARPIPEKMKEIPFDMVHPANVKFTADGVRIIDINVVLPNLDSDSKWRKTLFHPEIWLARYNRALEIWQIVHDEL